ncbi:Uncharacterized protein FKW44_019916 [Caligus rogercresseyi]|uniref:Uncharacterized protein n=1 Tax=Caligus rogercresseyi TaxID=217165 RepID=A0A7T8JZ45_CALRO|nr:Uncharacterized protein FKW44_019916 [Caligus rogercresseyi]
MEPRGTKLKLCNSGSGEVADFWSANFWPPFSPNTAPLDYEILGFVEIKACTTPHPMLTP